MAGLTDHDIADRIRRDRRCQICREDRRPDGKLCWDHHDELARMLDPEYDGDRDLERAASIPRLFARLDPTPTATSDQDRRAPGFRSTPPLSIDAVVMRDPRSVAYPVVDVWYDPHPSGHGDDYNRPHYEDESPPHAVAKAISGLAEALWEDLVPVGAFAGMAGRLTFADDPHGQRTVTALCRWLHHYRHHLTARDDADELHRTLAELHTQLRYAVGDPPRRPVANCTGWVPDRDTGGKIECGAPLYLPPPQPGVKIDPAKPVLRCDRCDRPYTHFMLLRLEIGAEREAS